jgi:hypothetical protein
MLIHIYVEPFLRLLIHNNNIDQIKIGCRTVYRAFFAVWKQLTKSNLKIFQISNVLEKQVFFIDTIVSLAIPGLQLRLTTSLFSDLDSKLRTNSQYLSIDQCRVLVLIC